MEIKTGKQKSLIIFVSFLVLNGLLLFFLVIPMVKKVYQQKDSLEEAKLLLKRDQDNINGYKEDLKYLKENFFLSEGLIIDENNRVKMIEELEKIASEENLSLNMEMYNLTAAKKAANKKEGLPNETSLKLSLSGKYENFLVFLYKLQNFKYVVNVNRLAIENFEDSKMKNLKNDILLEDLPEIEGEIIISFK